MSRQLSLIVLASLLTFSTANATHELKEAEPPAAEKNTHLTWHEFRHEMGSYPQVTTSMTDQGLITLAGHVDDGIARARVVALARTVEGATEIRNLILTD